MVATVFPAVTKALTFVQSVGIALVPPLRSISQVVTPAATQRARIKSTDVTLRAHVVARIWVPSVGTQFVNTALAKAAQRLKRSSPPIVTRDAAENVVRDAQLTAETSPPTEVSDGKLIVTIPRVEKSKSATTEERLVRVNVVRFGSTVM